MGVGESEAISFPLSRDWITGEHEGVSISGIRRPCPPTYPLQSQYRLASYLFRDWRATLIDTG